MSQAMTQDELRDHAEAIIGQAALPLDKRMELQQLLQSLDEQEQQVVCADAAVSADAQVPLPLYSGHLLCLHPKFFVHP